LYKNNRIIRNNKILNIVPIGTINKYGRKRKINNFNEYLNISKSFLEMLSGIIDGDGYFYIGKTKKNFIKINLSIVLDIREKYMLKDIRNTLNLGKLSIFKDRRN
jgi:hypothetical protein